MNDILSIWSQLTTQSRHLCTLRNKTVKKKATLKIKCKRNPQKTKEKNVLLEMLHIV